MVTTKPKRSFQKVDWREVQDTWDEDTTDSWCQLPPQQEETEVGSSTDGSDLSLPHQILVPSVHDNENVNNRFLQEESEELSDPPSTTSSSSSFLTAETEEELPKVDLIDITHNRRRARSYSMLMERLSQSGKQRRSRSNRKRKDRRGSSFVRSTPPRCFSYALLLWLFELALVVTLKRMGFIQPEFRLNEAVVQHVSPIIERWGNESSSFLMQASLSYLTQETTRPGFQLAQQGAEAKYPLLIIPGFVTSGLEVWGGKACARRFFRQRLWAAAMGARSFLTDRDCWRQHMMLDPLTGSDPEGIRLRASSGFEAIDYFISGYWVFGKIIENVADVGYSPHTNMAVEPYDWRLGFPKLEERDGFFTRVKARIEALHKTNRGRKVVITSHSMGVLVVNYFFAWVSKPEHLGGGGGGKRWVDKYVHAYVNIAGSHLGVPKAVTSMLSGEMSDTVLMNPMATAVEQFFGRKLRKELWSSWGSLWAMLPKAPDSLWSDGSDMCNHTDTESMATDPFCAKDNANRSSFLALADDKETVDEIVGHEHSALLSRRRNNLILHHNHDEESTKPDAGHVGVSPHLRHLIGREDFSLKSVLDYVKDEGRDTANAKMYKLYGSASNPTANRNLQPAWHDPTQTPLPWAPNMKIYCMYGVGKPTERAYHYKLHVHRPDQQLHQSFNSSEKNQTSLLDPPLILDQDVNTIDNNVAHGIKYSDGDGSVPLLSLGYLCADAWQRPSSGLNPSKAQVVTREYPHQPEFTVEDPMRNGPKSSDHVDILGNVDMTEDLLRILTDFDVETVEQDQISSDIRGIARRIHENGGGIFKHGNNKHKGSW